MKTYFLGFREYQKSNDWFETVFLPPLIERACANSKFPNQTIITEKQFDVCLRYMNRKESRRETVRGFSSNVCFKYETTYFKCACRQKGKWFFFEAYSKLDDAKKALKRSIEVLPMLEDELKEDIEVGLGEDVIGFDKEEIEKEKEDIDFLKNYIKEFKI